MTLKIDSDEKFIAANTECMRRAREDMDRSSNPETFDLLGAFVRHKENYWRNPLPEHTEEGASG